MYQGTMMPSNITERAYLFAVPSNPPSQHKLSPTALRKAWVLIYEVFNQHRISFFHSLTFPFDINIHYKCMYLRIKCVSSIGATQCRAMHVFWYNTYWGTVELGGLRLHWWRCICRKSSSKVCLNSCTRFGSNGTNLILVRFWWNCWSRRRTFKNNQINVCINYIDQIANLVDRRKLN